MNKTLIAFLVASAAVASIQAKAEQTASIGYAHSVADGTKLNGINLKYGYTPDDQPVGVVGSLTLTGADEKVSDSNGYHSYSEEDKLGYGSAMIGASYKINEYVKPYALVGVSRAADKYKATASVGGYTGEVSGTDTDTGFVYGAGVQITPIQNVVIDAGYEGTKLFDTQVNTFIVGVGYRW